MVWGVAGPVRGFEVKVAAQEGVERVVVGIGPFVVGGGGGVVPFVVFARLIEGGEGLVDVWFRRFGRLRRGVGGVEGDLWRAFVGVGHQHERLEHVWSREGTEGG